ncbi:MAG: flagellar protein FlaG [Alkalispirochaetaceae bacterium]
MALEVNGVFPGANPPDSSHYSRSRQHSDVVRQQLQASRNEQPTSEQIQQYLRELQTISSALNRRLRFDYNEKLEQMVVKVIDASTDKVIKELPPEELQRVHIRIREAIGLLIDETR